MKSRKIILALILVGLTFFLGLTAYFFEKAAQNFPLPVLGEVRDFSLTDSEGKKVSLMDLRGKVWIADFFFTTCSDICPMMSKYMAALSRSFALVKDVQLVSITVNPEYDSTGILSQYAKKFKPSSCQWLFLTGTREEISHLVIGSFKLGAIDEPIFHSSYFSLVDRQGLIRGYYDGTKIEEMNKLYKDTAFLLKSDK